MRAPGTNTAPSTPGHARLRGAVEIGVQNPNPQPPCAQRAGNMQRQRALADAALAGAHGHQMAYASQPLGDAGALPRHLLENPEPPSPTMSW